MSTAASGQQVAPVETERGRFSDGIDRFVVCASPASSVPGSFRVYLGHRGGELVLVVSGISSEDLRATWGERWRELSPLWKEWMQLTAFTVFYTGGADLPKEPIGRAKFCEG